MTCIRAENNGQTSYQDPKITVTQALDTLTPFFLIQLVDLSRYLSSRDAWLPEPRIGWYVLINDPFLSRLRYYAGSRIKIPHTCPLQLSE